jgi:putative endonuclease
MQQEQHKAQQEKPWCVYILMRNDQKLYTGITNNMPARWKKHAGKNGAKFFRGQHPIALCYQEPNHNRSTASQREHQIKQLSRQQKLQLITESYGPFLAP